MYIEAESYYWFFKSSCQTVNSNYTTPDDDQKYGRKRLGRSYGTVLLPPGFWHKNNKIWEIAIKINKQGSIVFN